MPLTLLGTQECSASLYLDFRLARAPRARARTNQCPELPGQRYHPSGRSSNSSPEGCPYSRAVGTTASLRGHKPAVADQ